MFELQYFFCERFTASSTIHAWKYFIRGTFFLPKRTFYRVPPKTRTQSYIWLRKVFFRGVFWIVTCTRVEKSISQLCLSCSNTAEKNGTWELHFCEGFTASSTISCLQIFWKRAFWRSSFGVNSNGKKNRNFSFFSIKNGGVLEWFWLTVFIQALKISTILKARFHKSPKIMRLLVLPTKYTILISKGGEEPQIGLPFQRVKKTQAWKNKMFS